MPRFTIKEIELKTGTRNQIEAKEIVASHIIKRYELHYLVLVVMA